MLKNNVDDIYVGLLEETKTMLIKQLKEWMQSSAA